VKRGVTRVLATLGNAIDLEREVNWACETPEAMQVIRPRGKISLRGALTPGQELRAAIGSVGESYG